MATCDHQGTMIYVPSHTLRFQGHLECSTCGARGPTILPTKNAGVIGLDAASARRGEGSVLDADATTRLA